MDSHCEVTCPQGDDVVNAFITFLYSDDGLPRRPKILEGLLKMGHMYEVSHLVEMAGNKIGDSLTRANLQKISTLAEDFQVPSLLDKCAQFCCTNVEVLKYEDLKKLPLPILARMPLIRKKKNSKFIREESSDSSDSSDSDS